jgi:hypothetical protein
VSAREGSLPLSAIGRPGGGRMTEFFPHRRSEPMATGVSPPFIRARGLRSAMAALATPHCETTEP